MPVFDETKFFIPIMILPWLYAVMNDKNNRWKLDILIPLVIILVDQSGLFIKKAVLRPRPWAGLNPDLVNHLVAQKGRNYSFPSNHAGNISGLAVVFSAIYYQYKYLFWSIAGIVIFSRVYIGVHYPIDILIGAGMGITIGIVCYRLADRFIRSK